VIVAIAVGRDGINTLLVASQVLLSVVLPFVAFPLIYLTSSEKVMRVRKPAIVISGEADGLAEETPPLALVDERHSKELAIPSTSPSEKDIEQLDGPTEKIADGFLDYSNSRAVACLAYAVWCVVLVANVYAIVMLGMRVGK